MRQSMNHVFGSSVPRAASVGRPGFWRSAGLCLPAWRAFLMVLTVGRRQSSAASYSLCSVALLPWPHGCSSVAPVVKAGRVLQAIGSNIPSQPTGFAGG